MDQEYRTPRLPAGTIEIAPQALVSIATQVMRQSYGVVGLAPRPLREGVAWVLPWDYAHRGIDVHQRDGQFVVDLYVVIAHGTRIAEVARNLQERVRYALMRALGGREVTVNVRVQGVTEVGTRNEP